MTSAIYAARKTLDGTYMPVTTVNKRVSAHDSLLDLWMDPDLSPWERKRAYRALKLVQSLVPEIED